MSVDGVEASVRRVVPAALADAPPAACDGASLHAATPPAPAQAADGFLRAGNPRPVLAAALDAIVQRAAAVLAVVLEADGSTYVRAGALALFRVDQAQGDAQVGWLSGGCLEGELARRAAQADADACIGWIELDTRDDAALMSGTALGCRGRLRIALLPLRKLPGAEDVIAQWLAGGAALRLNIGSDGQVAAAASAKRCAWQLPGNAPEWTQAPQHWRLAIARRPEALLLGVGPETPTLVRMLHELGWRVSAVESRTRWQAACAAADALPLVDHDVRAAMQRADAALVMHHDFERDLQALAALADTPVAFIGLLGPVRRRDDLFKLLGAEARRALSPRLRAPVGLDLGGQGPEAIALSIAAQLQGWRAEHA